LGATRGRRTPPPGAGFILLLQQPVALLQLSQLELGCPDARADTVLDVGGLQPTMQTRLGDPEVLGDLADRSLALTGDSDNIITELSGTPSA
jgi:hypothetical protein